MNGRENLFILFNKYDELLLTGTGQFEQGDNFFPIFEKYDIFFLTRRGHYEWTE